MKVSASGRRDGLIAFVIALIVFGFVALVSIGAIPEVRQEVSTTGRCSRIQEFPWCLDRPPPHRRSPPDTE